MEDKQNSDFFTPEELLTINRMAERFSERVENVSMQILDINFYTLIALCETMNKYLSNDLSKEDMDFQIDAAQSVCNDLINFIKSDNSFH